MLREKFDTSSPTDISSNNTIKIADKVSSSKKTIQKLKGIVNRISKDCKTIYVSVERMLIHPKYKKRYKRHKTYVAHDPNAQTKINETVKIFLSRPISKTKRWIKQ